MKKMDGHPEWAQKIQGRLLLVFTETKSNNKKQDSYRFVTPKGYKNNLCGGAETVLKRVHKTAYAPGSGRASLHRLEWAIRILEVIVLKTGKSGMGDGKRDTGKVGFAVDEQQKNHSNA